MENKNYPIIISSMSKLFFITFIVLSLIIVSFPIFAHSAILECQPDGVEPKTGDCIIISQAGVIGDNREFPNIRVIGPGDANDDDAINVSDITTVINVITGKGMAVGNADCNGDGSVNVSDITCIINIITAAPTNLHDVSMESPFVFVPADITIKVGDTVSSPRK